VLQRSSPTGADVVPARNRWGKIRWTTWMDRATIIARKSGDKR
jgi:hypothetical protein